MAYIKFKQSIKTVDGVSHAKMESEKSGEEPKKVEAIYPASKTKTAFKMMHKSLRGE